MRARALLLTAVLVAACGDDADPSGDSSDTTVATSPETIGTIDDGSGPVLVTAPEGLGFSGWTVDATSSCPAASAQVVDADGRTVFELEANGPDCDPGEALNGDHGSYRSVDQVLDPIEPQEVETPVGTAVVLEQTYVECTNDCSETVEPLAIVSLTTPFGEGLDTLLVVSPGAVADRTELTAFVESVATP